MHVLLVASIFAVPAHKLVPLESTTTAPVRLTIVMNTGERIPTPPTKPTHWMRFVEDGIPVGYYFRMTVRADDLAMTVGCAVLTPEPPDFAREGSAFVTVGGIIRDEEGTIDTLCRQVRGPGLAVRRGEMPSRAHVSSRNRLRQVTPEAPLQNVKMRKRGIGHGSGPAPEC